jgi:hypothetical protein
LNFYLKYNFEYKPIFDILVNEKKKRLNFFIDLQSICTGFYNRDVVLMEVGRYVTDGKISDILLTEYRSYLINLYNRFKKYDPYFVTFFDDGACFQNRALNTEYKNKNSIDNMQIEVENIQLFRTIKKYYFQKLFEQYNNNPEVTKAFYLKEYEADCIPHYCIKNNFFDSQESDIVNIILSKDKDLLQTCKFANTYQSVSGYKSSIRKHYSKLFNSDNCIEYIYPNFKRGILNANHIALILSIVGDKADVIDGIKNIGPAKAVKLIQEYNIPSNIDGLKNAENLPRIIDENLNLIINNLKLVDFDEQLKRIPMERF